MAERLLEIRDQDFAIGNLKRAIGADKLHHAYLFEGPPGVGKEMTARALAMAINCREDAFGCGVCRDCRKISDAVHPDVRTISPPEGKRAILIDSVREAEEWIRFRPHEGKSKVLIISPADAMNESAANALLKTLEEPRPGNHIILVTTMASSLLPTVRSRCQNVRFRALEGDTVIDLLLKNGTEADEATLLASLADGSMERAGEYSGEEVISRLGIIEGLVEGMVSKTPGAALAAAATLRDRPEAIAVLELLMRFWEELMARRSAVQQGMEYASPLLERFGKKLVKLTEQSQVLDDANRIAAVNKALAAMKRNNMNPQLAVENMVLNTRVRRMDETWSRIGR